MTDTPKANGRDIPLPEGYVWRQFGDGYWAPAMMRGHEPTTIQESWAATAELAANNHEMACLVSALDALADTGLAPPGWPGELERLREEMPKKWAIIDDLNRTSLLVTYEKEPLFLYRDGIWVWGWALNETDFPEPALPMRWLGRLDSAVRRHGIEKVLEALK